MSRCGPSQWRFQPPGGGGPFHPPGGGGPSQSRGGPPGGGPSFQPARPGCGGGGAPCPGDRHPPGVLRGPPWFCGPCCGGPCCCGPFPLKSRWPLSGVLFCGGPVGPCCGGPLGPCCGGPLGPCGPGPPWQFGWLHGGGSAYAGTTVIESPAITTLAAIAAAVAIRFRRMIFSPYVCC